MKDKQLSLWGEGPAKFVFVLLSGQAGAGKTTSANYMHTYLLSLNYLVTILPFAFAIKKCAKEFFGWDGKKDQKGRRLLQRLGTDVGREYDENIWVKHLLWNIRRGITHPDFVIVDDWRFPNEYSFIANLPEYEVIKIKVVSDRKILMGEEANHISEHALPLEEEYYDYVLDNTGSLEDLKDRCEKFLDNLLKGEL